MDSHNFNFPSDFNHFMSPFAGFQSDETSEGWPSAASAIPNPHGRYRFDSVSQSDPECINPAFLEFHNTAAMSDFFDDYRLPAPQKIQTELPPFHPEGFAATDFGHQQQFLQPQQGSSELTAPNALDTSADDCVCFDWPAGQRGSLAMLHDVENEPVTSYDSEHTANHE
jgi:hypothetical protein